ncbi:maleylacetate reductase [Pimelobacter simplex]|uniref:maleylacetate reductase n=1 Tax=Nocardioides simplex TaxID=2045 RepID=UPI00366EF22B
MRFVHDTLPQRVRLATGEAAAAVAEEVAALGARRVMVVASEREASLAASVTEGLPVVLTYDEVVMHVPVEVAGRARTAATEAAADVIVTVGGGSTTGLGKAVALTTGFPVVAVPTTYAGSEATDVWGLTEDGAKTTGADPRVLPRAVVYDATLMTGLPVDLSVASGLNALAHCVDSLWAPRADPINAALATEGARALRAGLPAVVTDPHAIDGRERTVYGAYLAAVAFASAGSGLHHKICHVLGGRYDLPHAQTHATVLPQVLALNAPNAPEADARLAGAFGAPSALAGLEELRRTVGAPRALRDHGFREDQIPGAVAAILPVVPPSNPTPVTTENLTALVRAVWEGADPA